MGLPWEAWTSSEAVVAVLELDLANFLVALEDLNLLALLRSQKEAWKEEQKKLEEWALAAVAATSYLAGGSAMDYMKELVHFYLDKTLYRLCHVENRNQKGRENRGKYRSLQRLFLTHKSHRNENEKIQEYTHLDRIYWRNRNRHTEEGNLLVGLLRAWRAFLSWFQKRIELLTCRLSIPRHQSWRPPL